MIADRPLASATPYIDIASKVAAFLQSAKVAASDGITWQEFGALMLALLKLSVETLDAIGGLSGEDKKAIALEAVASLFDQIADKAVPLAVWPLWVLAKPAIRSLVLALASGAIESILPLVRKV